MCLLFSKRNGLWVWVSLIVLMHGQRFRRAGARKAFRSLALSRLGAIQVGSFDDGAYVLMFDTRRMTLGFDSANATRKLLALWFSYKTPCRKVPLLAYFGKAVAEVDSVGTSECEYSSDWRSLLVLTLVYEIFPPLQFSSPDRERTP